MPFTYSDNPSTTGTAAQKRDAVRFLIRDTDSALPRVTDAEIAFLLATEANVWMAAAGAAEICAGRTSATSGIKSRKIGSLSMTYDTEFYAALADGLRRRGSTHQQISAPALSQDTKDDSYDDTDWPRPQFKIGMHDAPLAFDTSDLLDPKENP